MLYKSTFSEHCAPMMISGAIPAGGGGGGECRTRSDGYMDCHAQRAAASVHAHTAADAGSMQARRQQPAAPRSQANVPTTGV